MFNAMDFDPIKVVSGMKMESFSGMGSLADNFYQLDC